MNNTEKFFTALLFSILGACVISLFVGTLSEIQQLKQRVQNLEEKAKQFEQLMGH